MTKACSTINPVILNRKDRREREDSAKEDELLCDFLCEHCGFAVKMVVLNRRARQERKGSAEELGYASSAIFFANIACFAVKPVVLIRRTRQECEGSAEELGYASSAIFFANIACFAVKPGGIKPQSTPGARRFRRGGWVKTCRLTN